MENFITQLAQENFEAMRKAFMNFIRGSFDLNGDEIADIYNDVWIDVINNVRTGRTQRVSNWKAYIFSLGWKRAYKIVTRKTYMDSIDNAEFCEAAFQSYCTRLAESDASHIMHLRKIEKAMDELERLPEKHQAILTLYYIKGMSTAEIATVLGYSGDRSVITVKKRSLRMLQERMQAVA